MAVLPPHVLIFPLPLQGPVNSTLKLAELLSLSGLHVTFLVTDHVHRLLLRYSDLRSRLNQYPGFRLRSIPDGLPDDHPRSVEGFMELLHSLRTRTRAVFRDLLVARASELATRRPVTCVIADGILGFAGDVASDVGVPIFYVRTISACCLWVFFCLPKLIDSGEIPFPDDDLDVLIKTIPGMEKFLRRRDLPGFCRSGDVSDPGIRLYSTEGQEIPRAHGLILNTFDELERPVLAQIQTLCPNLYTIGPLHTHLKSKLPRQPSTSCHSSNSLRQEDRSCLAWLDFLPQKSVLYVSFGSLAVLTRAEQIELWYGLVNSEAHFLWVLRPDSIVGYDKDEAYPEELLRETKKRGYLVHWAPQEEILAHKAVGGFLTHSGWNSTLESIVEGVPMICWPHFIDQQVNSRFVGEVWGLGLDMKDTCDRVVVEKMVRGLMVGRKDEFQKSANRMATGAWQCLEEGGSSRRNLDRLIEDIQLMGGSTWQ